MIHIIKIQPISNFIKKHSQHKESLEAWLSIVKSCNWEKPQDVVKEFGTKAIDLLGNKSNRVVFDVKGNHIRIIAKYKFHTKLKKTRLYIKWIGTHAEYDKLCDKNLQYTVNMFK